MTDFDAAKELFKDVINPNLYFNSISAEIVKNKIQEALSEQNIPLIFVIGDLGVGKSCLLRVVHKIISQDKPTLLLQYPFFDKNDLYQMIDDAKKYDKIQHTVFIDSAELLNTEQFEYIRILSNTTVCQFVLSLPNDKSALLLIKKYFKSRTKLIIEYGNLSENDIFRYIQSMLIFHNHDEIASMFSNADARIISRYAKGNFRMTKNFLYTLMKLLAYTHQYGLSKYKKINSCLLTMTALEIGLVNDK